MFLSRQRGAWDGAGEWDRTTDRRRVGPEACLPAPAEGASPLAFTPRREHTPFEPPGRWFDSGSHEVWYGAGEWDRTTDLRFTKPLLYQLSYAGRQCLARKQDG